MVRTNRKLGIALLVVAAYAGLAVVVTWPLSAQLGAVLPGPSEDTVLHYWNGWAMEGHSPYHTDWLFYPHGVSLVTHNLAWFQIIPWLLLEPVLDGIVAYNVVLLFNLVLCGGAACLLAYRLSGQLPAAFLAGIVYLAWPFRLSQLDHPNLLATQWIPVFLLFLDWLLENGRWRDAGLTAVSFALVGYGRWQLLIPALVMGSIHALWRWRCWWPWRGWQRILKLATAGGIAILLLTPPAYLLIREQGGDPTTTDVMRTGEEAVMQTDLLAYLTPSNGHFLLRDQTAPLYDGYYPERTGWRRFSPYVGLSVLLLIAVAVALRGQKAFPWLLMALALIALALGPVLRVNGVLYPQWATPYRLLEPLQLFRLMRVPDRYNMFLALPVAMMVAYGVVGLGEWWGKHNLTRRRRGAEDEAVRNAVSFVRWYASARGGASFAILFSIVILLDYLVVPVPLYRLPALSPYYQQLAAGPEDAALLNLPIDALDAKWYMYTQLTHRRPLVQGNLSRIPPGAYRYIDGNPWLNSLHYTAEFDPRFQDVSRRLRRLAADGVGHILLQKNRVGADRILHWQRYLLSQPRYEDEEIAAYATDPQAGRDFTSLQEMAPGLGPVRVMVGADCVQPGHALEVDVGWGTTRALTADYETAVSLTSTVAGHHSQSFPLTPDWPSSQWPAHALAWGYYKLTLPSTLPAGQYELQLTLRDAAGATIGDPHVIQTVTVQEDVCPLAQIPGAANVNAAFGDRLRLLAYELERGDPLHFRLYWQATQRMETDYKIFIHIFDPATGVPVAQDDAMPHRNAYPTRFWGLQEVVADDIFIDLGGVAPGEYGLAIGVYDPITGQRLTAVTGEGVVVEDGRFLLPETVLVE